jgi:hypothetical protein
MAGQFLSMNDVLEADARGEIDDAVFDSELWMCLVWECDTLEPSAFEPAVRTYIASSIIQGEVANGGFAQAAYNSSRLWFEDAAVAYEIMGLPLAAARIAQPISPMSQASASEKSSRNFLKVHYRS